MAASQLDLIEERLYLGELAAATNVRILKQHHISHILTVDSHPLPEQVLAEAGNVRCHYVEADDRETVDLLSRFDECLHFVEDGVQKGTVLVHCYYGVSRSATIVCAYLMRKYQLDVDSALNMLKEKRSVIYPNSGFVSQLQLFAHMKWKVDLTDSIYQLFVLQTFASEFDQNKIGNFTAEYSKLPLPSSQPKFTVKCKTCRHLLLADNDVIKHHVAQLVSWENLVFLHHDDTEGTICPDGLFIKPQTWIKPHSEGKITCPKCTAKLGSYKWEGSRCPCGARMTPIFFIMKNRVDLTFLPQPSSSKTE